MLNEQIYGDGEASSKDCFKMFNPTDPATYNVFLEISLYCWLTMRLKRNGRWLVALCPFWLQRVLKDWTAAFFTIFKVAPKHMDEMSSQVSLSSSKKFESMDDYLEGYLMDRSSRYGKRMEVLDLGMQEIRTYFRLFLLSFVLLMFMFCSRISKSKSLRPSVSSMSL